VTEKPPDKPLTEEQIRAGIEQAERELAKLYERREALHQQIRALDVEVVRWEMQRHVLLTTARLQRGEWLPNVDGKQIMEAARRLAISQAKSPGDEFIAFISTGKERGRPNYTLRSLAKALKISPTLMSMYRQPKTSATSRPIPHLRAKQVEKLTGWPADEKHWPGGITR